MTPQFLRHEAARFRGMAEEADREATRARLLAMAADYEARAGVENGVTEPNSDVASSEVSEPQSDKTTSELAEPNLGAVLKINPGRKIAARTKETVLVQHRSVGRPRRE
jgi:hypothetical protein